MKVSIFVLLDLYMSEKRQINASSKKDFFPGCFHFSPLWKRGGFVFKHCLIVLDSQK